MEITLTQKQLEETLRKVSEGEEGFELSGQEGEKVRLSIVKKYREAGSLKGKLLYMADDFDKPLEDFEKYMPKKDDS